MAFIKTPILRERLKMKKRKKVEISYFVLIFTQKCVTIILVYYAFYLSV